MPTKNDEIIELRKEFRREIRSASQSYSEADIFRDACRMFAISFRSPLLLDTEKKKQIEDEFKTYTDKYGKDGSNHISKALVILVKALETHRGDFLGRILEDLNATNKSFSQYFTPDHISRLMADIVMGKPEPNKIVTICDPACGAGSLLIEAAESFIENGGRQGDIFLSAQDLDYTAFNISFVQFSLLGYPAEVTRMNSLSMEVYEGPWQTAGYFLHHIPMRMLWRNAFAALKPEGQKPVEINVQTLTQSVFDFK